uniref:ADP ribosyltransferase domain-containing protein n=1 Tax=Paramoeba aestuarina TaxID=180227 RepID=A0A7S4NH53_9EUKA|mmetsp:Transcript_16720/g.26015  ORF Transcript_16720/g.26015 Transcript_16720/m.26015 type:complete len:299 (+) Transcript_16720:528-1424(+)
MMNYYSGHLDALSKEEKSEVFALHGKRDQYDIIPEFNFQNALHSYPRVSPLDLDIDVNQHPQVLGALLKYAENTETFRFNMCLNLLNKASNPHLFKNLLLGCIGSAQTTVPDVVFRKAALSDTEFEEFRNNVGKNYLSKSFMSTSAVPQHQFPGILFKINLEAGKRKGAIDLRHLDTMFNEQEILLSGYSVFRVDHCNDDTIELTYLDYYQYEHWKEKSEESGRRRVIRADGARKMSEKEQVQSFNIDFGAQFKPGEFEKLSSQFASLEGKSKFSGGVGSGSALRGQKEDIFYAATLY